MLTQPQSQLTKSRIEALLHRYLIVIVLTSVLIVLETLELETLVLQTLVLQTLVLRLTAAQAV